MNDELQKLLLYIQSLERELRSLEAQHHNDAEIIADMEQRLANRHQVKFIEALKKPK